MTLRELSVEYRATAQALRVRITELRTHQVSADATEALLLARRIRMLEAMWRETRDLAVLTERYYERGYRRNAKYTI